VERHSTAPLRDLAAGIGSDELEEGSMIEGTFRGERVLIARVDGIAYAVGGLCTHYGASLAGGLLVDDTVRCPLHHACFNLRTGDAQCGPALAALPTYDVTEADGLVQVRDKKPAPEPKHSMCTAEQTTSLPNREAPRSIVIVGTGAAGTAAAEMLRREGYDGRLVMIGAEKDLPYDRPNLSKDYLAGTACDEWLPLKPKEFYSENGIELMLGQRVTAIDVDAREVRTLAGRSPKYDRLLLATGSEAVRLPIPTHGVRHVFTLRTLADSRAIIAAAQPARRAVVVGSSFIGLEVSAALRARGLEVDVVAPSGMVFEGIFGPKISTFIQDLHRSNGVRFHLRDSVRAIDDTHVTLVSGKRIAADLVVVGIGVRPSLAPAQWAHLRVADGVVVDEYLETSTPRIFAAGDIARWPDRRSGDSMRVEHWSVAIRQGQTAARNMIGQRVAFDVVPYFWSQHYDVSIQYVGRQGGWDELVVDGDPAARDCAVTYQRRGEVIAVATIGREIASLRAEVDLERGMSAALTAAV